MATITDKIIVPSTSNGRNRLPPEVFKSQPPQASYTARELDRIKATRAVLAALDAQEEQEKQAT